MTSASRLGVLLVVAMLAPAVIAQADDRATRKCEAPAGTDPFADPSLAPPKKSEAERHRQNGKTYHRAGDFEHAIEEFKEGSLIEGKPVFLYSLAQSYRMAGDYRKAIYEYQLFLDHGQPGQALRDIVECNIDMMKAELEHAAMTSPPIDLPPDPGTEPNRDQVAPAPGARDWYTDPIGWGLVGGGVVFGAVAGVLLVGAADLDDQAAAEDREDVRDQLRARADTRRTWGLVLTGTGVVALAAGVVKLILTPDAPTRPARPEAGVSLVVGPGTVGLVGRF